MNTDDCHWFHLYLPRSTVIYILFGGGSYFIKNFLRRRYLNVFILFNSEQMLILCNNIITMHFMCTMEKFVIILIIWNNSLSIMWFYCFHAGDKRMKRF